jgi:hypothetical protein
MVFFHVKFFYFCSTKSLLIENYKLFFFSLHRLCQVIMALGDHMNVQAHACIGGKSLSEDIRKLDHGVHVVSGTPGRVFGESVVTTGIFLGVEKSFPFPSFFFYFLTNFLISFVLDFYLFRYDQPTLPSHPQRQDAHSGRS